MNHSRIRARGRKIFTGAAIAAVLGTAGALLVAIPASAAPDGVTATISTSCDEGGTVVVSAYNSTPDEQRIHVDVDDGNDGEWNYLDHFYVTPGGEFHYPIVYGEDGEHRVAVTMEDGSTIADEVIDIDCEPAIPLERFYVTRYDGTVWRVTDGVIQPLSYAEWQAAGFPQPEPAPTDYVRYAWSSTISAVTFFGPTRDRWVWHHVSSDEWGRAGFPSPRNAGWIQGSTYYQWSTSDQIFVQDVGGVRHALTYVEWAESGFEPFERRTSQGFSKLTWDNSIAFFTNTAAGQGSPIGYDRWASEGFPQPSSAPRFPGDQVWRNYGSPDIWYAGPTVYRRINSAEWAAMGNPAPEVRGTPAPQPGGGGTPSRPTVDKDCRDFGSRAEAQAEFDRLYPAYGDIYDLDRDGDRKVCETFKY